MRFDERISTLMLNHRAGAVRVITPHSESWATPQLCSAQAEVVRREFRKPSLPEEELIAQRALIASKVPPMSSDPFSGAHETVHGAVAQEIDDAGDGDDGDDVVEIVPLSNLSERDACALVDALNTRAANSGQALEDLDPSERLEVLSKKLPHLLQAQQLDDDEIDEADMDEADMRTMMLDLVDDAKRVDECFAHIRKCDARRSASAKQSRVCLSAFVALVARCTASRSITAWSKRSRRHCSRLPSRRASRWGFAIPSSRSAAAAARCRLTCCAGLR